ncbi:MAG: hypothetical protein ACR2QK_16805, partial [Acidimicrobiales bacterium]
RFVDPSGGPLSLAATTGTSTTAARATDRPIGAGSVPGRAGEPIVVEPAPTFLAARLPPSWSAESQVLFEIYGNLWRILQNDGHRASSDLVGARLPGPIPMQEQWQIPVGRHWVLMTRMDDDGQPVAAVAIRKASFSPAEAEAFGAVVGSVVAACSDSEAKAEARRLIRAGTAASLKSEGRDLLAEVNADWQLPTEDRARPVAGRRTGVGRGPDPVTAVARAAAKACRPRCEVTFAGSSELEDVEVTIVMIRHAEQGLKLGYAVGEKGDRSAAAEAVFTAAG